MRNTGFSRIRLTLAIGPLALLGACGSAAESGEVYPKSGSEVRQMLAGMDSLPPVFGSSSVDTSVINNGDGSITWTALQQFKPVMRFVARTEAVDDGHTRVTLDVKGGTDAADDKTGRYLSENPTIRNLYLAAMTEQVDATLEDRAFDYSAISGQLAIAAAANMGRMTDSMDKAAVEYRRREEENVAKAYEQEANGGWDRPPDDW